MIERFGWSWSPVGDMEFSGEWCDGELRICDEVFICDVECVSMYGGVFDSWCDPDTVVLASNMNGVVRQRTSGAVEVFLRVTDLSDYGASTYLEGLLAVALD